MTTAELKSADTRKHESDKHIAERVVLSELFKSYQEAISAGTGLAIDFVATDDTLRIPYAGGDGETLFCRLLREGTGNVWETANAIVLTKAQEAGKAITVTSLGGLLESAIPVRVGMITVGYLRVGQALPCRPTKSEFQKVADRITVRRGLCDLARLEEAYLVIPVIPLNRYMGVVELVKVFAELLAEHVNRLMLMKRQKEPQAVEKAKRFVVENIDKQLCLERVASQACVTGYYLCRIFKESTGMTLTEFIGRLRVEKAKQLLLNVSLSITEIAFSVGFNSLSQFNRVFLRYAGQTPTKSRGAGTGELLDPETHSRQSNGV